MFRECPLVSGNDFCYIVILSTAITEKSFNVFRRIAYELWLCTWIWGWGWGACHPGPYGSYAYDRDTADGIKSTIIYWHAVETMYGMVVGVNDQVMQVRHGGMELSIPEIHPLCDNCQAYNLPTYNINWLCQVRHAFQEQNAALNIIHSLLILYIQCLWSWHNIASGTELMPVEISCTFP